MKLTEEQRQEIIASYKLSPTKENASKLSKEYNITTRYIYKLLKQDKENELNNITDKTSEFTKKANKIITLALQRLENEIITSDKINIQQLTTTIGILYDKSRLENNLSTDNKAININIKIE